MVFLSENVFLKILSGEIPCEKVYEDDTFLAFYDIAPKAKIHVLIIPKEELKTAKEINEKNVEIFGRMFLVAKKIATDLHMKGYKLSMNVDEAGGQIVPHMHLHLLSGDYKTNL